MITSRKSRKLVLAILCLTAPSAAYAGVIRLPATGQILTYAAGDDGALNKGVAVSGPRFTDNGNGTVTDNLTDLIWLKNANCFTSQTWSNALGSANRLSSGGCGLSDGSKAGDWRLPNADELESLLDLANYSPALPTGHPFTSVQTDVYWTSTTSAPYTDHGWGIDFDSGLLYDYGKIYSYYVWPVRTGQSVSVQYSLNTINAGIGSGTVTSTPPGISCTGSCSVNFDAATQVTLIPTVSAGSFFAGWSGGGCSGTGNCQVTLNNDTTVKAFFSVHPPVNLDTAYYSLIGDAYANAVDGDTINIRAVDLTESPVLNFPTNVALKGGFDGTYTSNDGYTALHGSITLSSGTVTIENLIIK